MGWAVESMERTGGKPKGRGHLGDQVYREEIEISVGRTKMDMRTWDGLMWLRIVTSCKLL